MHEDDGVLLSVVLDGFKGDKLLGVLGCNVYEGIRESRVRLHCWNWYTWCSYPGPNRTGVTRSAE